MSVASVAATHSKRTIRSTHGTRDRLRALVGRHPVACPGKPGPHRSRADRARRDGRGPLLHRPADGLPPACLDSAGRIADRDADRRHESHRLVHGGSLPRRSPETAAARDAHAAPHRPAAVVADRLRPRRHRYGLRLWLGRKPLPLRRLSRPGPSRSRWLGHEHRQVHGAGARRVQHLDLVAPAWHFVRGRPHSPQFPLGLVRAWRARPWSVLAVPDQGGPRSCRCLVPVYRTRSRRLERVTGSRCLALPSGQTTRRACRLWWSPCNRGAGSGLVARPTHSRARAVPRRRARRVFAILRNARGRIQPASLVDTLGHRLRPGPPRLSRGPRRCP